MENSKPKTEKSVSQKLIFLLERDNKRYKKRLKKALKAVSSLEIRLENERKYASRLENRNRRLEKRVESLEKK